MPSHREECFASEPFPHDFSRQRYSDSLENRCSSHLSLHGARRQNAIREKGIKRCPKKPAACKINRKLLKSTNRRVRNSFSSRANLSQIIRRQTFNRQEEPMTAFRTLLPLFILAAISTSAFAASAPQNKMTKPPAMSVPLTTERVFQLYYNRTWIWKDGAGYFAAKHRDFRAWSGEGTGSYGVGHWFVTDPGKLCFRATWYAKTGKALALTCFSHRKKSNVIFQKREPNGDWYPFKTTPAKADDEYQKVRPGDYATAGYNRMRVKLKQSK